MNDIRIRFEDTIGDYARMLEDFASSPVLMEGIRRTKKVDGQNKI